MVPNNVKTSGPRLSIHRTVKIDNLEVPCKPKGSNLEFKGKRDYQIDETQFALIDNFWGGPRDKLAHTCHALYKYFTNINENLLM